MFFANRPWYIERGASQCFLQPVMMENTKFYCFLIDADGQRLQDLCDKHLNSVTRGKITYHPLGPFLILGFSHIAKGYSLTPPDNSKGWIQEHEVAFWVPVVEVKHFAGFSIVERIVWYMPYIWVSNPLAVAMGRETYGYNKQEATFQFPSGPQDPLVVGVDALAIPKFDANLEIHNHRIVEVSRQRESQLEELEKKWETMEEGFSEFSKILFGQNNTIRPIGLDLLIEAYDLLVYHEVPTIFLKQFRDIADGRRACYQAITLANVRVTKYYGGGPLVGDYQIDVHQFDSHPIITDLGLTGTKIIAKAAFRTHFDSIVENGEEIWRSDASLSQRLTASVNRYFSLAKKWQEILSQLFSRNNYRRPR